MAKKTMTAHVHADDMESDTVGQQQEMAASVYGSARKPQVEELVETVEIDDFDLMSADHQNDDQPTKAIVARGRSVDAAIPRKRRLVGQTNDGVQVYGPVTRRFGPGETVELAAWEVRRLQELGFLVDPSKVEPAINDGKSGPTAIQENTHSYFRSTTQ